MLKKCDMSVMVYGRCPQNLALGYRTCLCSAKLLNFNFKIQDGGRRHVENCKIPISGDDACGMGHSSASVVRYLEFLKLKILTTGVFNISTPHYLAEFAWRSVILSQSYRDF